MRHDHCCHLNRVSIQPTTRRAQTSPRTSLCHAFVSYFDFYLCFHAIPHIRLISFKNRRFKQPATDIPLEYCSRQYEQQTLDTASVPLFKARLLAAIPNRQLICVTLICLGTNTRPLFSFFCFAQATTDTTSVATPPKLFCFSLLSFCF